MTFYPITSSHWTTTQANCSWLNNTRSVPTHMITERRNPRSVDIDLFPTERILKIINAEDALVASAVAAAIPDIAKLVDVAVQSIRAGGNVIYVGAGTSGRIANLDAAECPPTFSTPPEWVQAVL